MKDPEPYAASLMPEDYMSHLSDNQARAIYGGSVYRPSREEMWKRDNPPIFNAPTAIDAHTNTFNFNPNSSRSGNDSTSENLRKIRQG